MLKKPDSPLSKKDFETLADFRYQLRRFLRFSEEITRALKAGVWANGRGALRKAKRTGRPPRLTDAEKKHLVEALEAGALAQGYATDLWTLARGAKLIAKISGKRYSESGVWRLLKGLNFSCQRPSGRASKRDEAAIRQWKKKRWPALKKTAREKAEQSSSSTSPG
jgi:transposase